MRPSSSKLREIPLDNAEIIKAVSGSEKLLEQLLYDAFTYIMRPYHQSIAVFKPLWDGFKQIRKTISDENLIVPESVSETIERLAVRTESEYSKAGVRTFTIVQAWAKLRREFGKDYRVHDPIPQSILLLRPGQDAEVIDNAIGKIEANPAANIQVDPSLRPWLTSLERNWNRCQSFLDYTIFPLLDHIKPILLSEDGRRFLGGDTVEMLVSLIEDLVQKKIPVAESPFSLLIKRIARNHKEVLSRQNWENFKREVQWFWDLLKAGGEESEPSRLINFIQSAPSDLGQVFREIYGEMENRLPVNHKVEGLYYFEEATFSVFCTSDLLRDLIRELLQNIETHLLDKNAEVNIYVSAEKKGHQIEFCLRNDSTAVDAESGNGLNRLRRRLKPFEALMDAEPRPNDHRFTFEVKVLFLEGE